MLAVKLSSVRQRSSSTHVGGQFHPFPLSGHLPPLFAVNFTPPPGYWCLKGRAEREKGKTGDRVWPCGVWVHWVGVVVCGRVEVGGWGVIGGGGRPWLVDKNLFKYTFLTSEIVKFPSTMKTRKYFRFVRMCFLNIIVSLECNKLRKFQGYARKAC